MNLSLLSREEKRLLNNVVRSIPYTPGDIAAKGVSVHMSPIISGYYKERVTMLARARQAHLIFDKLNATEEVRRQYWYGMNAYHRSIQKSNIGKPIKHGKDNTINGYNTKGGYGGGSHRKTYCLDCNFSTSDNDGHHHDHKSHVSFSKLPVCPNCHGGNLKSLNSTVRVPRLSASKRTWANFKRLFITKKNG